MRFGRLAGSLLKHRSGIINWKLCCWIPLVSLWASRPISTFALQSGRYTCRYSNSNSQSIPNINSIMPRRSSRVASSAAGIDGDKESVVEEKTKATRKRKIKEEADIEEEVPVKKASPAKKKAASSPKRKIPAKKAPAAKGAIKKQVSKSEPDEDDGIVSPTSSETKKGAAKKSPAKKKAADHQRVTERDELPKLWNAEKAMENGSYTFKIASWNVAGLRAVMKKTPDAISNMCKKYDLDMLCLQETKLQESHLDDPKLKIRGHLLEDDGYDAYYSCSTAKKGYSGTAVFIKRHGKKPKQKNIGSFFSSAKTKGDDKPARKEPTELPVSPEKVTPENVSYKMGKEIDAEGRIIMVDLPFASIANVYVPNSGQTLERLSYRTGEWDKDFLEFMQKREKDRGLPVIWLGDLNVAHTALDVWNDGAKHLAKQAGVTPEERAMFQEQLDAGFVDAFRKLHGSTTGQYSYWSQRAGNREPNKGLRLDYFICSLGLFSEESSVVVRDSYMLPDELGSDHCPVVIELEMKSK